MGGPASKPASFDNAINELNVMEEKVRGATPQNIQAVYEEARNLSARTRQQAQGKSGDERVLLVVKSEALAFIAERQKDLLFAAQKRQELQALEAHAQKFGKTILQVAGGREALLAAYNAELSNVVQNIDFLHSGVAGLSAQDSDSLARTLLSLQDQLRSGIAALGGAGNIDVNSAGTLLGRAAQANEAFLSTCVLANQLDSNRIEISHIENQGELHSMLSAAYAKEQGGAGHISQMFRAGGEKTQAALSEGVRIIGELGAGRDASGEEFTQLANDSGSALFVAHNMMTVAATAGQRILEVRQYSAHADDIKDGAGADKLFLEMGDGSRHVLSGAGTAIWSDCDAAKKQLWAAESDIRKQLSVMENALLGAGADPKSQQQAAASVQQEMEKLTSGCQKKLENADALLNSAKGKFTNASSYISWATNYARSVNDLYSQLGIGQEYSSGISQLANFTASYDGKAAAVSVKKSAQGKDITELGAGDFQVKGSAHESELNSAIDASLSPVKRQLLTEVDRQRSELEQRINALDGFNQEIEQGKIVMKGFVEQGWERLSGGPFEMAAKTKRIQATGESLVAAYRALDGAEVMLTRRGFSGEHGKAATGENALLAISQSLQNLAGFDTNMKKAEKYESAPRTGWETIGKVSDIAADVIMICTGIAAPVVAGARGAAMVAKGASTLNRLKAGWTAAKAITKTGVVGALNKVSWTYYATTSTGNAIGAVDAYARGEASLGQTAQSVSASAFMLASPLSKIPLINSKVGMAVLKGNAFVAGGIMVYHGTAEAPSAAKLGWGMATGGQEMSLDNVVELIRKGNSIYMAVSGAIHFPSQARDAAVSARELVSGNRPPQLPPGKTPGQLGEGRRVLQIGPEGDPGGHKIMRERYGAPTEGQTVKTSPTTSTGGEEMQTTRAPNQQTGTVGGFPREAQRGFFRFGVDPVQDAHQRLRDRGIDVVGLPQEHLSMFSRSLNAERRAGKLSSQRAVELADGFAEFLRVRGLATPLPVQQTPPATGERRTQQPSTSQPQTGGAEQGGRRKGTAGEETPGKKKDGTKSEEKKPGEKEEEGAYKPDEQFRAKEIPKLEARWQRLRTLWSEILSSGTIKEKNGKRKIVWDENVDNANKRFMASWSKLAQEPGMRNLARAMGNTIAYPFRAVDYAWRTEVKNQEGQNMARAKQIAEQAGMMHERKDIEVLLNNFTGGITRSPRGMAQGYLTQTPQGYQMMFLQLPMLFTFGPAKGSLLLAFGGRALKRATALRGKFLDECGDILAEKLFKHRELTDGSGMTSEMQRRLLELTYKQWKSVPEKDRVARVDEVLSDNAWVTKNARIMVVRKLHEQKERLAKLGGAGKKAKEWMNRQAERVSFLEPYENMRAANAELGKQGVDATVLGLAQDKYIFGADSLGLLLKSGRVWEAIGAVAKSPARAYAQARGKKREKIKNLTNIAIAAVPAYTAWGVAANIGGIYAHGFHLGSLVLGLGTVGGYAAGGGAALYAGARRVRARTDRAAEIFSKMADKSQYEVNGQSVLGALSRDATFKGLFEHEQARVLDHLAREQRGSGKAEFESLVGGLVGNPSRMREVSRAGEQISPKEAVQVVGARVSRTKAFEKMDDAMALGLGRYVEGQVAAAPDRRAKTRELIDKLSTDENAMWAAATEGLFGRHFVPNYGMKGRARAIARVSGKEAVRGSPELLSAFGEISHSTAFRGMDYYRQLAVAQYLRHVERWGASDVLRTEAELLRNNDAYMNMVATSIVNNGWSAVGLAGIGKLRARNEIMKGWAKLGSENPAQKLAQNDAFGKLDTEGQTRVLSYLEGQRRDKGAKAMGEEASLLLGKDGNALIRVVGSGDMEMGLMFAVEPAAKPGVAKFVESFAEKGERDAMVKFLSDEYIPTDLARELGVGSTDSHQKRIDAIKDAIARKKVLEHYM
jgi:hypothetical protein